MPADSPFDIMAETYDDEFTHSNIGQLQRNRVWECLLPIIDSYSRPLSILEINCGTGEDAIMLARLGHCVTATDASRAMISKAEQKADLLAQPGIVFEACSFDELSTHLGGKKFDLVISNFGGLNCIPTKAVRKLSNDLTGLLNSGGKLFFVVMGTCCMWEMLYFLAKGKLRSAFRRQRKSVSFGSGETQMDIFYHSPRKMKQMFKSLYHCEGSLPVGLLIPPSYLEKFFSGRPRPLQSLARLENRFGSFRMLSNLSDHFCIIFKKKEAV